MQYNEIDARGVQAICDAARELPRLRRVELNGNKFAEEDPNVEKLRELLEERKSGSEDYPHLDDDDEDAWGVDDLDELEDEDSDEENDADEATPDDDDDDDDEAEQEKVLKDADIAENEPVTQKKDAEVDDLADALSKTELK